MPIKKDDQIQEAIEEFMQNALMLIDNSDEDLQSAIITCLAKMSIIEYKNFGLSCFATLKDIMKSGSQMEEQVIKFLRIEVINKLRQPDPTTIPVGLLQGLYDLIDETEIRELLVSLFDFSFGAWLEQIVRDLHDEDILHNHTEHYDAVINLLKVSLTDEEEDENVQRVLDRDLIQFIV